MQELSLIAPLSNTIVSIQPFELTTVRVYSIEGLNCHSL